MVGEANKGFQKQGGECIPVVCTQSSTKSGWYIATEFKDFPSGLTLTLRFSCPLKTVCTHKE